VTAPDCRTPGQCPVPDPAEVDLRRLRLVHLERDRILHRVFETAYGLLGLDGSGRGDARFSPVDGRAHLYGADTRTVALLETVFHNVHETTPRLIYPATDLAGRGLGRLAVGSRLPLVDLRDEALAQLGLQRRQLVATTAAHHPCTRAWAAVLLGRRIGGVAPSGLLWISRVAELAGADSPLLDDLLEGATSEVCVLYEHDGIRVSDAGGGFDDLVGPTQGRLLVDRIADQLEATILS
jgi:hypothetical protein